VPVILIAGVVGYYKFYLPNGIVAEVNGEEIRMSELDAAVARMKGMRGASTADLRYRALNELIAERLVLQEARKAGVRVTKEEVAAAAAEARTASGLDEAGFQQAMTSLYGSVQGYEKDLECRLMINHLITERVLPAGADPQTASRTVNQWLRDLSGKATVRVALTEQLSGPSCGCCNSDGPQALKGTPGCAMGTGRQTAPGQTKAAAEAALRYWHAKHGPDAVTTRATDFGCHTQIDIIKENKKIGSLRYQNGTISEL
jgi:hypothetical protein